MSFVWVEVVSGISIRTANNTIWSIIQRLVVGATVYYIWQERNGRLYQKDERSVEVLFCMIVETIRMRLMSLKIKYSNEVIKAAAIWRLPLKSILRDYKVEFDNNYNDGIT